MFSESGVSATRVVVVVVVGGGVECDWGRPAAAARN